MILTKGSYTNAFFLRRLHLIGYPIGPSKLVKLYIVKVFQYSTSVNH